MSGEAVIRCDDCKTPLPLRELTEVHQWDSEGCTELLCLCGVCWPVGAARDLEVPA